MIQQGDGSWQKKISMGLCPRCDSQMKHITDGIDDDYMDCNVCNLTMLTPRYNELQIIVELEE